MSKLTREGFRAMHEQAAEALERSRSSLNVLICAGTGCIASGSMKVYENLREECAQWGCLFRNVQLFRDYPVGCGGLQGMQCLFPSAGNAYMPALLYKYPGYFLSDA